MNTTKTNNKAAIIYVRVSSAEQVKGTSLDEQERLCREYCKRKGMEVKETFIEEGASAKTADRIEFLKATEFCRKNQISAFVVWKLDRFSRKAEDHLRIRSILQTYGSQLHSVTENISQDMNGRLMETMLAGFAEFDNDVRRMRCSNGMQAKIRSGIYPHKPPVGYICEQNKKKGEKKTQPDPTHPKVFPLIRSVLIGYMNQTYTQTDMVKVLKEARLEELCGTKATKQAVDRIIRNYLEYYSGRLYCKEDDKFGLSNISCWFSFQFRLQKISN